MFITKLFKSGNSMAIRIPKTFHFKSERVTIKKKGKSLVINEVPDNLSEAFSLLSNMPDDFYCDDRVDLAPQERESL